MKTMLFLWLVREYRAHSLLCLSCQGPAEMIIDPADGGDGMATDLTVGHVANATRLQSIAFSQKFLQRFRPVLNGLPADDERIDRIAKHATEDCDQAGYRRHGFEGRPVCLNKERIGIDRKKRWQGKHMCRRLQHPTGSAPPELQMLKETAVIFVCGQQILTEKPTSIRRHIIHRIKLVAQKGWGHEADTFLRELGAQGMDVAKRGCQPIEAVTTLGCAPYSLSLILTGGRGWRHYFPGERNSMLRIGSEQGVQKSGAAPRQTHNKKRFADFLSRNAGIKLSVPFQKQT